MRRDVTVFVVDPHESAQKAIRDCVHTMNLRCQIFTSGHEFLDAYTDWPPGCVVLEVKIPDMNGLEVQERLAERGAGLPVIFLTDRPTVSLAVRTLRAGALNFLEKPFRESELWDAIEEALRVDEAQRRALMQRKQLERRLGRLTPKERHLLRMIAQGRSKKAMASEAGVCVRTIEIRKKQLMTKLGEHSVAGLVRFAVIACDWRSDGASPKAARAPDGAMVAALHPSGGDGRNARQKSSRRLAGK